MSKLTTSKSGLECHLALFLKGLYWWMKGISAFQLGCASCATESSGREWPAVPGRYLPSPQQEQVSVRF